ncbi:DNA mismatch repair protein MutS [Reichenbachiella sp. MALMAid0571]|uniref:MutS-related protein n=1 Tax=Reichenbachiella sp. MALMAid0571 TaxID=3143939 RepID=UPI0032DFBAC9
MTPNELKSVFTKRIQHFTEEFESLNSKHKTLSLLRVALFISLIGLVVYAANIRNPYLLSGTIIIFFVAFGIVIQIHNRIKFKRQSTLFAKKLNEEEIHRLNGNLSGLYDGLKYEDKNHFYAPDLDIFGSNSLFQLVIRSRVEESRRLTADWLLHHAPKAEILKRQQAILELKNDIDWRQNFTALGMHTEEVDEKKQTDLNAFTSWISAGNKFIDKSKWKILSWVMPLVALLASTLVLFFDFPYQIIFVPIIINFFLLKVTFAPLLDLTKKFDAATKVLKSYENLILAVENKSFTNEKLSSLKSVFDSNDSKASKSIQTLRRTLYQLLNRANMLYFPLNVLFLLDLIWLLRAEQWKKKHGGEIKKWFDAIHEIDALNDMASLTYSSPDFVFPEITDNDFQLDAKKMGHPLIHGDRVKNDFQLNNRGKLGLITGSNMSGKSTFLRTVGINLVMAQAGLPVCAHSFSCSPTRVFTSMRTQDNLEEHISSFYAELKRIKQLLDSINESPVFYLLDEILKGTNSEDRHKGSISLINQLSKKNATGLISTHDLTLSNLENEQVKNYSFNSEIVGDEIIFDYKLTEGPCRSFNASKLMEKMGIIVNS